MFKTLYSRILSVYLAITVGAILLIGLVGGIVYRNQVWDERESSLAEIGENMALYAENRTLSDADSDNASNNSLTALLRASDALLLLYHGGSGETEWICTDPTKWASFLEDEEAESFLRTALEEERSKHTTDKLFSQQSFSVLSYYTPLAGGAMLLVSDNSATEARLHTMKIWLLGIALAELLFSAVLIAHNSKKVAGPVREMNGIVRRFTKGDFSSRISQQSIEEYSQLSRNINRMADSLTTLEDSRRTFVANVSHELRSPLTSMRGFLEAILDGTIPKEEQEHYLNIVLSENKRMTDMVNDFLDLSRIESGQNAVKLEPFDINDLIVRSLLTFEARILAKNIDVDVSFAQDRSFVLADQAQIAQVIRNLVDNAIKFTPDGGMLRLTTALGKRLIAVSVQDSGEGIAREDIPYVFDRFYKGEKAHTASGTASTGLGLAIVKKILDQHGQSIRVDSSRGKGTCFTFTLKRTAEPMPKKKLQEAE